MDNPTHLLAGYFLSRAGLNRLTPRATAILLLGANIPDVDIVALAGGGPNYLHWHRYWTHTWLLSPLLAIATVAIVWMFVRKPLPWLAATMVAWIGVASHLFLDWTNQYGIRFLVPFSPRWYQLDIASLFDPWIYSIGAVCLFAPFLGRLVGGEIGARNKSTAGQGWAVTALVCFALYFTGRGMIHARMVEVLDSRTYDGANALRVAAFPYSTSPFRWRGVAETAAAWHVYELNAITGTFDPDQGRTLFKAEMAPAIEAVRKTPACGTFQEFAQYPLWIAVPSAEIENGTQVSLVDLRFPFYCRALVDSQNRVQRSEYPVYGW
jgi:inner membrane protein